MFKLTKLITAAEEADRTALEAVLNAAAQRPGVTRSLLNPTLPGGWNPGDYVWHLQFDDEAAYRAWQADPAGAKAVDALIADASQLKVAESVAYNGGRTGVRDGGSGNGIYRVMLCTVYDDADEAKVRQFEDELFGMGTHIHSVRNWQVSRSLESSGSSAWTHVWEQDYDDLSDLLGPYMMHPYHWAMIDRWFDPQHPDLMFDGYICHTFCNSETPMVAPE